MLLSLLGGCAGTLFAWWSVRALVLLLHFNPVIRIRPNLPVLCFTIVLSILTGLLFGIIPAWKLSHLDPRPGHSAPRGWRTRRFGSTQILIAIQIALSLCLLMGAALLARSLAALEKQNVGFTRDRILLLRTDADVAGYQPTQYSLLYRNLSERFEQLPGVQAATLAQFSPVSGYSSSENFSIRGYHRPNNQELRVWRVSVGPQFFETLKIPLLLGRTIHAQDTTSSTPVALVNQAFVDRYMPKTNPLGQHISHGEPFKAPGAEIVGVVANSKFYDLRANPQPMVFHPISQVPTSSFELVLRTAADPESVAMEAKAALKQINGRLPVLEQNTLDQQIEHSLDQQKLITTLSSIFGILALLLASIGIYGTLAYSVSGRTAEIGIRMALGAPRSHVIWLVVRNLLVIMALGLVTGLPIALGGTRLLKSFLFGVQPADPLALATSVLLIIGIALFAGYLPAYRGAKIDPIQALRHD